MPAAHLPYYTFDLFFQLTNHRSFLIFVIPKPVVDFENVAFVLIFGFNS